MSQESQRTVETKERIRDAFFELYENKKIEKISIKEITEIAQLNRGTFYVYYKDIYDLLEKTEDELIDELIQKIRGIVTRILRAEDVTPFLPPLEFYQRNRKMLRSLFGPNGDPNFIHKIKKIVKIMLREVFQEEKLPEVKNLDYVMEYISSAQIGMISYWLIENNMGLSVAELGDMIKRITLQGPVEYIKSQAVNTATDRP